MKIYAFEVRNDERVYLDALALEYQIEIECIEDILTIDRIKELDEGSAVSILGHSNVSNSIIEALAIRNINYLSTRTVGYDHIDIKAAKEYGIHVCSANYGPNGVADYTVMMILLCLRKYKQALWRMQVNDFSLNGLIGKEMCDLTIGIIGTGRIGRQVIKTLSGFGSRILCYDKHPNSEVEGLAQYVSLDELYKNSDVISLHLNLSDDTYHIIDREAIAKMKDGVILINCARGSLMDIQALIEGIENEKIGALGLDTVEEEEKIIHRDLKTEIFSDRNIAYLRQFKNVVYTYHMAFYTDSAVESMARLGIEGIIKMINDEDFETRLS